ncbi:Hypothetical protein GLP15_2112 [Giardia lamblia P15]|uniref:Uncharacterized protein n=1 Tax=Giardia intestinalis (strain P15) TaxID=658858 RepID=E1EY83_GIAIA|nr:Hypothetical protein GLP15_2112 [Giardia lamblia P15]
MCPERATDGYGGSLDTQNGMTKADQPDPYALVAENEWLEQEIAQMERKINEMALQANNEAERTIEQLHASDAAKKIYETEKATTIATLTAALKAMEEQNTFIEGNISLTKQQSKKLQDELADLTKDYATRRKQLLNEVEQEKQDAEKYSNAARDIEDKIREVELNISSLQEHIAKQRSEKENLQKALEQIDILAQDTKKDYSTPYTKDIVDSLKEELIEIRTDIVKFLVETFEDPCSFTNPVQGKRYRQLLFQLKRKKTQLVLATQQCKS